MTTAQRLLMPVLAAACLGLGIYAYSERLARMAAEDRLLSAQTQNARLAETQISNPALPPVPTALTEPVASDEPAPSPDPSFARPAERRGPPIGRQPGPEFTALMESPEMQQLMNLRARGNLDSRYASLFKILNLSPDQLQRFQQLLVDKQNTTRDVIAAMRSQGLTPGRENSEQTRALVQSANAEIDAQIRSELGEATFAQYQNYDQTRSQRAVVERVQQRLGYTGTPLSDQQAASLVDLLVQTAPTGSSGGRGFGSTTGPINNTTLARAQTFLSASQMAALQELQREQQAQAELQRRARQSLNAAGPGR